MNIIIYSENLLGNSGGAEVYALRLGEILSTKNSVRFLTHRNSSSINCDDVFTKYSVKTMKIDSIYFEHKNNKILEVFNRIFLRKKIMSYLLKEKTDFFINCSHNRLIGFGKITSYHIIHFPMKCYSSLLPGPIGKILDRKYCKSYRGFISNSEFTKYHLKKEWGVDSFILNPPIAITPISYDELVYKEKKIVMVGRLIPDKKILEVVKHFVEICNNSYLKDYLLIIVGNTDSNFTSYFQELKKYEKTGRVIIKSDISYKELNDIYKQSEIFIHAKGFHEDENLTPMKMEHFGMTTVEAMANGCIPIVINKAGQREIVDNNSNGFLWNELNQIDECLEKINNNIKLKNSLQFATIEKSKKFLLPQFNEKALNYFNTK